MTGYLEAVSTMHTRGIMIDEKDYIFTLMVACDAYCKVCGHYAHSVPTHICRHDCRYYSDFQKAMKAESGYGR